MTANIQNMAPRGRGELDRDRDTGGRSEPDRSLDAASMNLERHPVPSKLFRARSFEDSRRSR